MKHLILIATCIVLLWVVTIISCKKDEGISASENKPPIARAGNDISITFPNCQLKTASATLDGRGSSDPDYNITSYNWAKIYGPNGVILTDQNSIQAHVQSILAGEYAFELTVGDKYGLVSRDTILIRAKGPAQEYDFDITLSAGYGFVDNYKDCYYYPCTYSDLTTINSVANFLPVGQFIVDVSEYADTAVSSDVHNTTINMQVGNGNSEYIGGTCTVNFKKLIRDGGGAFNGTFTANYGSAQVCGNVFNNLSPLNVSGNLDVITHSATITIKGKVYL